MPYPVVRCVFQDSRGYLWLGTEKGLCQFDGKEFRAVRKGDSSSENGVNVIWEDRRGNIWTGMDKGVMSYSSAPGFQDNPLLNRLAPYSVYSIQEDARGQLWFGASNGLHCFDGEKIRHFSTREALQTELILSIAIEKTGKLWLGSDRGLASFDGNTFISLAADHESGGRLNQPIIALLSDSAGNLWIGSQEGLHRLRDGRLTTYTTHEGLTHNSVNAIAEDADGKIWIGTWDGVTVFSGAQPVKITTRNGLPDNFVYSVAQDSEGGIWFGTHGGASRLMSLNLRTYTQSDGLPNETLTEIIQDRNGACWFGTSEGLSCFSGGHFKNYTTRDGLIGNAINGLLEDHEGRIWIATYQGLSIFARGKFANYTIDDGLASNIIFKFAESRDGTVWIRLRGGLTRWNDGKFSAPPFYVDKSGVLCIMADSKGNLWFSVPGALNRFDGRRLLSFTTGANIGGENIDALFEDRQGKIWISSEAGLSSFSGGKFTHYPINAGFRALKSFNFILEDGRGKLWLGHSDELSCFDGKNFTFYSAHRLGLTERIWTTGMKDRSGRIWIGSSDGVTVFNPPPAPPVRISPPIYITGLKVMEKDVSLHGKSVWPHNQNIFRFTFAGLHFSSPEEVRYKYQMENIDSEWRTTHDRSLFFPFLPPGSYNLRIKAVGADGVESRQPAEHRFEIRPPFWSSGWFKMILGMVGGLMLALSIHWRVRRVREKAIAEARKTELELMNRQLAISQRMELMGALAAGTVHDLKNLLAVIIDYSRAIGQDFQNDDSNRRNINIIRNTAATAVQMVKQILSFARPRNQFNDSCELAATLSEILDTLKVMQPGNIQMAWKPPTEPILFPIQPGRFQQLIMNLCINAFHAMPVGGLLEITLSLSGPPGKEIILEVADTGAEGIPPENMKKIFEPLFTTKKTGEGSGLGLFVVKQIVDEYHGDINVRSQPGQGTIFIIRFPANPKSPTLPAIVG